MDTYERLITKLVGRYENCLKKLRLEKAKNQLLEKKLLAYQKEKKGTNETIKKVIMRNQATFHLRIFLISKGEFYKFLWLDEHFSQFFFGIFEKK